MALGLSDREVRSIWDFLVTARTKTDFPKIRKDVKKSNKGQFLMCSTCRRKSHSWSNFEIYDNKSQFSFTICSQCSPSLDRFLQPQDKRDEHLQFTEYVTHLHSLGLERTNQEQEVQATIEEEAEPYIKSGLAESFAIALVKSEKPDEILNLWEAKWWKQYEPNDILITSVLDETLTEQEARSINQFRGEHRALAMACIKKQISTEWAEMLLSSGFDEHPDAVLNVLEGADPVLIARIRGMDVNDVPPPTGIRILMSEISELKEQANEEAPAEEDNEPKVSWREDVLLQVMSTAGIDESHRDAFVAHAANFDLDDNGNLKKAELEAAAEAWNIEKLYRRRDRRRDGRRDGRTRYEAPAEEASAERKACRRCGAMNEADAKTCSACSVSLSEINVD